MPSSADNSHGTVGREFGVDSKRFMRYSAVGCDGVFAPLAAAGKIQGNQGSQICFYCGVTVSAIIAISGFGNLIGGDNLEVDSGKGALGW